MHDAAKKDRTELTPEDLDKLSSLLAYYSEKYAAAGNDMRRLGVDAISVTGMASVRARIEGIQSHLNVVGNAIVRKHAGSDEGESPSTTKKHNKRQGD